MPISEKNLKKIFLGRKIGEILELSFERSKLGQHPVAEVILLALGTSILAYPNPGSFLF